MTSAVPANAELALKRVNMQRAFDAIITAADVQRGKPDPEGYLKAAATLSIPIGKCVVIEDSIPGIRAAKAAARDASRWRPHSRAIPSPPSSPTGSSPIS